MALASDGRLNIRWADGRAAALYLAALVNARVALAPLRDAEEFARAAVSADGWSLEWPCGIDFGSAQLRRWAEEQAGAAAALTLPDMIARLEELPPPEIERRDEECLPERDGL